MYLAASPGPGGLGFLVFAVFVVAAIVIFIAMVRSMRRMRAHVDRGDFGVDRRSSDASRKEGPPKT